MSRHHVFTDEVYWALVRLKDEGGYVSIDEALRPVLGLSPGCETPHLKHYEEQSEKWKQNSYLSIVSGMHEHSLATALHT